MNKDKIIMVRPPYDIDVRDGVYTIGGGTNSFVHVRLGVHTLHSYVDEGDLYPLRVVRYVPDSEVVLLYGWHSPRTIKHVNMFLNMWGFKDVREADFGTHVRRFTLNKADNIIRLI